MYIQKHVLTHVPAGTAIDPLNYVVQSVYGTANCTIINITQQTET